MDKDRVQELVDAYVAESPAGIEKIREALNSGPLEQVAAPAHELKSTSATLGVTVVRDLCQKIEAAAKAGKEETAAANLAQLPQALAQATRLLGDYKPVAV